MEGNKDFGLRFTKGRYQICFDLPIYTQEGNLWTMHVKRKDPRSGTTEHEIVCFTCTYTVRQTHRLFGHMNEEYTRKTAKQLGYTLTKGGLKVEKCESCAIGGARQKNLGPGGDPPTAIGELWYIDGTSIKRPTKKKKEDGPFPVNHFAVMIIEAVSGTGFVGWFKKKSDFHDPFLRKMDGMHTALKYSFRQLRADGAGENKTQVEKPNGSQWKFCIEPEYTPRATPQMNTGVETPIKNCARKARIMQADANVPHEFKNILFPPSYKCALQLQGLEVITVNNVSKCRIAHLMGKMPPFTKYRLHCWGEAAVIKIKSDNQPKLEEYGVTVVFIGYCPNHPGDCYCFFNPKTLKTYQS